MEPDDANSIDELLDDDDDLFADLTEEAPTEKASEEELDFERAADIDNALWDIDPNDDPVQLTPEQQQLTPEE